MITPPPSSPAPATLRSSSHTVKWSTARDEIFLGALLKIFRGCGDAAAEFSAAERRGRQLRSDSRPGRSGQPRGGAVQVALE